MTKDKLPKSLFVYDIFAVLVAFIPCINSIIYRYTESRMDYHLLLIIVLISFIVISFTSAALFYTYPKFFYQALIFSIASSISLILTFVFDYISGYNYPIPFVIYPVVSLVSWFSILLFRKYRESWIIASLFTSLAFLINTFVLTALESSELVVRLILFVLLGLIFLIKVLSYIFYRKEANYYIMIYLTDTFVLTILFVFLTFTWQINLI
ncbi:MAG TPA: hypothetical protein GXZ51_03110 [Acholeplasma sp.]|jgi:hypothetical protein|nr:hypothetical protein [Acholeplasma sp.]HKM40425.1 hypothetical protein [Patescibacteria group bacterium]